MPRAAKIARHDGSAQSKLRRATDRWSGMPAEAMVRVVRRRSRWNLEETRSGAEKLLRGERRSSAAGPRCHAAQGVDGEAGRPGALLQPGHAGVRRCRARPAGSAGPREGADPSRRPRPGGGGPRRGAGRSPGLGRRGAPQVSGRRLAVASAELLDAVARGRRRGLARHRHRHRRAASGDGQGPRERGLRAPCRRGRPARRLQLRSGDARAHLVSGAEGDRRPRGRCADAGRYPGAHSSGGSRARAAPCAWRASIPRAPACSRTSIASCGPMERRDGCW